MHELAVTESILNIAVRHAEATQAARITDLYLVVGELASIVDDSVQFYWDFVSEGSIAAGATLHFRRVAAQMQCQICQHSYAPSESLPCPSCGSTFSKVTAGEEFYLEAIDVEPAPEQEPIGDSS